MYKNLGNPRAFICYTKKGENLYTKVNRKIYIIENRDTFWSFNKAFGDLADMIIYGVGKKILSSFKFISDYNIEAVLHEFPGTNFFILVI